MGTAKINKNITKLKKIYVYIHISQKNRLYYNMLLCCSFVTQKYCPERHSERVNITQWKIKLGRKQRKIIKKKTNIITYYYRLRTRIYAYINRFKGTTVFNNNIHLCISKMYYTRLCILKKT